MTFVVIAAAVVLALIGIISMRPSEFRTTRSIAISSSAQTVFEQVNDFHNWLAWFPWEKSDPATKRTYEGPSSGTGAVYSYAGSRMVGEGRMTILESRACDLITVKFEFLKPMACTNVSEFTFKSEGGKPEGGQPESGKTVVTWSMTGSRNFIMKASGLVMDLDKMVGDDFEKGLATMKSIAEKHP